MGILPCCTRRGKTSMKPSSIDDPVVWNRPFTGRATTASTASDGEPAAPRPPQPATEHERPIGNDGRRRRRIVRAGRSSPEMVSSSTPPIPATRPIVVAMSGRGPAVVRRRPRRLGRPAGPRARLARPRRSRRRRVRGARRRVHAPLGRRRAGDHAPHVGGDRPTGHRTTQRLRRGPPREPLHRVPAGRSPARSTRTMGRYDAIVEIWNGVPWFSPVWRRTPGITFLHHVHGPMWDQILPGPTGLVRAGARGPAGAAVLPPRPDGDPVRRHPGRAARTRLPPRSGHGDPQRHRPDVQPGRAARRRTRRSSRSGASHP